MTWFPARNSNGIEAVITCAEATPATTTRAAVAIITFVVSFFIVLPSFGFATALPICMGTLQLACHSAGARKALKPRSRDVDFRQLLSDWFTAVNRKVHPHPSLPA